MVLRKPTDDLVPDPGSVRAAEATNVEECLAQHKEALKRVLPVGLVYGNASKDDAKRIWKTVRGWSRCTHPDREREAGRGGNGEGEELKVQLRESRHATRL